MALINPPPSAGGFTNSWLNFFNQCYRLLNAMTTSGTTAQRPTSFLWAGRPYFDTTLSLPIWYDGSGWIDAAGNTV
jgi:hypothetical protein